VESFKASTAARFGMSGSIAGPKWSPLDSRARIVRRSRVVAGDVIEAVGVDPAGADWHDALCDIFGPDSDCSRVWPN